MQESLLENSSEFNMNEICRLCRSPKGVMSYIFRSAGVDTSTPLSERIMSFVNIRMREGDGLPSLICHRCLYQVEQMTEFKILCQQSDAVLRQYAAYQDSDSEFVGPEVVNTTETETESATKEISEEGSASDAEDENTVNCPTCNKRFKEKEALQRHNFIHIQDGPFPCDYCEESLPDKALLRVHWRQIHSGNKPHLCQTCGEAFKHKENLVKHNVRHDKIKPFRCSDPSCKKAFAYRSDLRKHSVIHSGIRPYVCPVCLKAFTRSTNLNKHARVHNGSKPFPCDQCEKMFATRGDLMRHSMIHTGEKPYSCAICFISFNRKDKLSRHEKLHNETRAHVCSECPTSFNRKEDLTKHVQFHHYSTIFADAYGDKEIKIEPVDENGDIDEKSSCSMASDKNEDQRETSETEDVVINVDPLHWEEAKLITQCDICLKNFKTPSEAAKHRLSHEKSRNFICEVCRKGFHQRRELVRHALTHTDFKPHSCDTCGKAFSRRDKLRRHERIHLAKANSNCTVCATNLTSETSLTQHLKLSPCCKPFQCNHCASAYSRKDKLVRHIKTEHNWAFV